MESISNFFMIIFLFFLPLLLVIIFLMDHKRSGQEKLPPGPWKLPLIGNLHQLGSSSKLPHVALKELASKHGPLMHLKLGERSTIVISSYQTLKQVMKTSDTAFANRPEILVSKTITYNSGDLVFAPYGDYWKQMRKICILELLSPKRVQSIYPLMEEEISRLVTSINKASISNTPINLTEGVNSLTCAIICRASVGMACKDPDSLILATKEVSALAGVFNISDLFPSLKFLHSISGTKQKLLKMHKECDRLLEEIVLEHEASIQQSNSERPIDQEDLLHVLLKLKESHNFQIPITRDNVKAIVLDMFLAGSESTGTTLEWAMSELLKKPTVMEKVQAEVRESLKGKKIIDHTDIQNLKYLKLVVKETLRLHPPGPLALPRESTEQCVVNGYIVPSKTIALVNMWAMGRDPQYWDDPEKFEPERFNLVDNTNGIPFELVAFGFGKRLCPGMSFGTTSLGLILARLLYYFDWKLPGKMNSKELDMTEKFGGSVGRKNNLYLIASPYLYDSPQLCN